MLAPPLMRIVETKMGLMIDWHATTITVLPGESKKAGFLLERSMKTESLISKIGIVFDLQ